MTSRISIVACNQPIQESPFEEMWYDTMPHITDSLYKGVTETFSRVIDLFCHHKILFHTQKIASKYFWQYNCNEGEYQDRKRLVLDIFEKLAQQYSLDRVSLYTTDKGSEIQGYSGGSSFSDSFVAINSVHLQTSSDIVEFVLAHELAHIRNDHFAKASALKASILVLESILVTGSCFATPWLAFPTLFLIEAIAAPIENFVCRSQEKVADLDAMRILKSNRQAITFFKQVIARNKFIYSWAKKEGKETYCSPEGNLRSDLTHPKVTERLRYAQNFQVSDTLQ